MIRVYGRSSTFDIHPRHDSRAGTGFNQKPARGRRSLAGSVSSARQIQIHPTMRLTLTEPRDERNAWKVWLALFLLLSVGICLGSEKSVAVHYSRAALRWLNGEPLYNGRGSCFIYLPQAAILHVPFALLPRYADEILWRALTIGLFALGLLRLCRLAELGHQIRLFPLATCVSVPLAFAAARNGQTTLLIAGLIMISIADLTQERRWRPALLLCLAVAFKPTALPFVLLIALLHRPLTVPMVCGMLGVAAFPWLVQHPQYVSAQYMACADSLRTTVEVGIATPFAHLFAMLDVLGIIVPPLAQSFLRIAAAIGILALLWGLRTRLPAHRYGMYLFTLTTGYLLLFNPRTENNTYAFLSPAIGLFCAETFLVNRNYRQGGVIALIAVGMLGGYEFAVRLAPHTPPIWLTSSMAVAFLTVVGYRLHRELGESAATTDDFACSVPYPTTRDPESVPRYDRAAA